VVSGVFCFFLRTTHHSPLTTHYELIAEQHPFLE
jgi:hypothetical protein